MSSRMPSSIRLAITISPSRVSSSTVPISRIYMRTGICCSTRLRSLRRQALRLLRQLLSHRQTDLLLLGSALVGVGRLLEHLNAHVVNHLDDVFDLIRLRNILWEVVVNFGVCQVALLFALWR